MKLKPRQSVRSRKTKRHQRPSLRREVNPKRSSSRSLLLASGSPRRAELLATAGYKFDIVSPYVVERFDCNLTLRESTALNAVRKGMSIARANPNRVVLAADTLVALDTEILGKPRNLAEAALMLQRLSGRIHTVCSAVFLAELAAGRVTLFSESSRVRFRHLSPRQIEDYMGKINPLDKAGAYAAQGHGAEIIARIEGSYTNVVGLPMEKTIVMLREFGIVSVRP